MKCQLVLLLWTLTAFVSYAAEDTKKTEIVVTELSDGIKLKCTTGDIIAPNGTTEVELRLPFNDDNTGEYKCDKVDPAKIYVKFRSCDNCVQLDEASIAGIVVGDVVATIVIGVAVYLIASKAGTGAVASDKKRSDKRPLVPNEESSRGPNEHYQVLRPKGQKDTYDVLHKR